LINKDAHQQICFERSVADVIHEYNWRPVI
jgi:hypothetical protein